MAATQAVLAELPTEALMREIQRRLECTSKPEKRLILVGARLRRLGHTHRVAGSAPKCFVIGPCH